MITRSSFSFVLGWHTEIRLVFVQANVAAFGDCRKMSSRKRVKHQADQLDEDSWMY